MLSEALLKSPVGSFDVSEPRGLRQSNSRISLARSVPTSLPPSSVPRHSFPNSLPHNSLPGSLPAGSPANSWRSRSSRSESELSLSCLSSTSNSHHASNHSPDRSSRSFVSSIHANSESPLDSALSNSSSPQSARFFSQQRIVASSSYHRWLVAPAALGVHLSIGQVYAFSVFNNPLSILVGLDHSASDDWTHTEISWIFSAALIVLGLSGVVFGRWIEKVGPRLAMFVAAICFSGGFFISALGIHIHEIWVVYVGYGLFGGIGLGIGYISPVSTLLRWFPDRPGMATGIAIMGFGGGAALASPLSLALMEFFHTSTDLGVRNTFIALGALYFWMMLFGALIIRIPPRGWESFHSCASIPAGVDIHVNQALRTPQFWVLWFVLVLNITAGIGILVTASSMIQEMFPAVTPKFAAMFVVLLSLSNMLGRFVWSTLSDVLGRNRIYSVFFTLGALLFAILPSAADLHSPWVFVSMSLVIVSMYGGGFATLPAYIRDLFGTMHVVPTHGCLLTAWSVAGVAGPFLLMFLRQDQIDRGVPKPESYHIVFYILAAMLAVGCVANFFLRPVATRYYFTRSELA